MALPAREAGRHAVPHRLRPRLHVRHRRAIRRTSRSAGTRASSAGWTIWRSATRIRSATSPTSSAGPDGLPRRPGADELRRAGCRQRRARRAVPARHRVRGSNAEPVGVLAMDRRACRDMNELRTLLTTPDLERHVVRLQLDMAVSLSEENEVERILRELQGTDATHGRAGILLVDKTESAAAAGLRRHLSRRSAAGGQGHDRAAGSASIEDAEDEAEKLRATRALAHLYKLLQSHEACSGRGPMKIRRLRVTDFAAIREADIEFGPGLNVLYGPNDLGKSTLADAIRLALLLPHTSTPHRRVRPVGGRPESRRRADVRDRSAAHLAGEEGVPQGRRGDAGGIEERRGLRRGRARSEGGRRSCVTSCAGAFPSPAGRGGSKGLPTSFLATVLLSTQADVTAVLSESLQRRSQRHRKGADRRGAAGRGAGSAVRRRC